MDLEQVSSLVTDANAIDTRLYPTGRSGGNADFCKFDFQFEESVSVTVQYFFLNILGNVKWMHGHSRHKVQEDVISVRFLGLRMSGRYLQLVQGFQ